MFRGESTAIDAKLADLEAKVRQLETTVSLSGISQGAVVAAMYGVQGDLLMAAGPADPVAVGIGPPGSVLTADPAAPEGASWKASDAELLVWMSL